MGLVTKLVEEYGVAKEEHSWILMNNVIHGIAEMILAHLWALLDSLYQWNCPWICQANVSLYLPYSILFGTVKSFWHTVMKMNFPVTLMQNIQIRTGWIPLRKIVRILLMLHRHHNAYLPLPLFLYYISCFLKRPRRRLLLNYWFDLFGFCGHHATGAVLIQRSWGMLSSHFVVLFHCRYISLFCNNVCMYVLACTKTLFNACNAPVFIKWCVLRVLGRSAEETKIKQKLRWVRSWTQMDPFR
jgi:hypothetical protein